jgi:drug/metabolite transporter (DMT)-like permease
MCKIISEMITKISAYVAIFYFGLNKAPAVIIMTKIDRQKLFGKGTVMLKSLGGQPGIAAAIGAALLFGAATPLAKLLLVSINPWLLAGLLYLGSGIGLTLYRLLVLGRSRTPVHLSKAEWGWFAGAIFAGGVIGPVLQMVGFDRRILLGMLAIVAGTVVLSWPAGQISFGTFGPGLALLGACLAWAVDNNLMRKVAASDAIWLAAFKGWVAGFINLGLAIQLGATLPAPVGIGGALVLGSFAYGLSLALFIVGLRHLGTARTGAYFSIAPFFGATVAILLLGETISLQLLLGAALMMLGVGLHLSEKHAHAHQHRPESHTHSHSHDLHHQHPHADEVLPGAVHSHRHEHERVTHTHQHFPDTYHQHQH